MGKYEVGFDAEAARKRMDDNFDGFMRHIYEEIAKACDIDTPHVHIDTTWRRPETVRRAQEKLVAQGYRIVTTHMSYASTMTIYW